MTAQHVNVTDFGNKLVMFRTKPVSVLNVLHIFFVLGGTAKKILELRVGPK